MSKRECGDCSACCVYLTIDDPKLKKPPHTPCVHLCKGCSIYKDRPQICKSFQCYWLSGELSESMKPNKKGLLFSAGRWKEKNAIQINEREAGIIDSNWELCKHAIQRINQRFQARGTPSERAIVFLYGTGYSDVHTYAINEGLSLALAKERMEQGRKQLAAIRKAASLSLAV